MTAGLYQSADLFVLPTVSDGFAITQLEAMAHGLPVIATPHCGQVVQHEVNGLIIPARDAAALAAAVERLMKDRPLLESMRGAAMRRVEDFSLASQAQQIEAAAKKLL
jgi:glycosyltransferase involved in cell wall biosynthesis